MPALAVRCRRLGLMRPASKVRLSEIAGHAENAGDGVELKIANQPPHSLNHLIEATVMAPARRGADGHPGLIGIDFPRMEVEDHGSAVGGIHALDTPARNTVREQPEVAASSDRQVERTDSHGGCGHLDDRAGRSVDAVHVPGRIRNAVAVVMNWENARV